MSIELIGNNRLRLIREYGLIFNAYPGLRVSALRYWEQVQDKDVDLEVKLFDDTVLEISNQLLDNPVFLAAMDQAGKDPIEHAIIESFFIIDVVLDVEAAIRSKMQ